MVSRFMPAAVQRIETERVVAVSVLETVLVLVVVSDTRLVSRNAIKRARRSAGTPICCLSDECSSAAPDGCGSRAGRASALCSRRFLRRRPVQVVKVYGPNMQMRGTLLVVVVTLRKVCVDVFT